jgi:hypothetical protein
MVKNKLQKSSDENIEQELQSVCPLVLTKGKRKGLSCNRKILVKEEKYCKFHQEKTEDKSTSCTVILTKGERKNQSCNRKIIEGGKLCKIHQNLEDKRPYNPYIEKESDVIINKKAISNLGELDMNKMHPRIQSMQKK